VRLAEPVLNALDVHSFTRLFASSLASKWFIGAELLDEATVAGMRLFGCNDPVEGGAF